jgi:hypothetical protein
MWNISKNCRNKIGCIVIKRLIREHLTSLEEKKWSLFARCSWHRYDRIPDPFFASAAEKINFNLADEEEYLIAIRNDLTLQLKHSESSLFSFWILIKEYPSLKLNALQVLIQFWTLYFCEFRFSAIVNIKYNKKERLKRVYNEMRVCLSKIRPDIQYVWPPLWSSEDYKHRGPGFDSRALLRIFLRELGLERGPLSLVIG